MLFCHCTRGQLDSFPPLSEAFMNLEVKSDFLFTGSEFISNVDHLLVA